MIDALTPDELGDVGESLFRKLCSQGKLICNKSDRDRTGWDFRVEFPIDAPSGITLDQRSPRVCQVQLKSTAGGSETRVPARLSSIERLAKDGAPAAVVVLRMRPDGTELMGYVIHLIDKELARILRRLRRAEADGRRDINHMTITFNYLKGKRFKPTGDELREALAEICQVDVAAYAEMKRHQLASLGYDEGGGMEAEALLWIESPDHFTKILSGLAPLKPERLQAYDRRFGIRVPCQGTLLDGLEEFYIHPPAVGPCDIIMRDGPLRPAALFRCEAFAPPPIDGGPRLVIRHTTFSVLFREDGLEFETTGNFIEGHRALEEWILLLRGLSYLAGGNGSIELEFQGAKMPPIMVSPGAIDGPYIDQLPRLLEFVERWQHALQLAGVAETADFSLDDIWSADVVQMSLDILLNPTPLGRIEFDAIEVPSDEAQLEALFFNSVHFAGVIITFATKVTLERDPLGTTAYASTRFALVDIRSGVLDLGAYGAELATRNNIKILIDPRNLSLVNRPLVEGPQGR